jgi:hypothetical protein
MRVMAVVTVMVPRDSERRECEHHQEEGGNDDLLHGTNLAREPQSRVVVISVRIKTETGAHSPRAQEPA